MIHSFVRVLRVEWENEGAGIEEWSSMSVNTRYLIMCSVEGRLYIFQFDRSEEGHLRGMRLVYKQKTDSWYCCVDLSSSDMALLCCDESDTPTGLLYVNLSPLAEGKPPHFDDTRSTFHFNGGVPSGEEGYMVRKWGAIVLWRVGRVDALKGAPPAALRGFFKAGSPRLSVLKRRRRRRPPPRPPPPRPLAGWTHCWGGLASPCPWRLGRFPLC